MKSAEFRAVDESGLRRSVKALCRAEPRFSQIVERHGLPPLWPRDPGFATLALLMLEQQVSLSQARAMYMRIDGAGGVSTGTGMKAYLKESRIHLLSNVRGQYEAR